MRSIPAFLEAVRRGALPAHLGPRSLDGCAVEGVLAELEVWSWAAIEVRAERRGPADFSVSAHRTPRTVAALRRALSRGGLPSSTRTLFELFVEDPRIEYLWIELDSARPMGTPLGFLHVEELGPELASVVMRCAPSPKSARAATVAIDAMGSAGRPVHLASLAPRGLDAVRLVARVAVAGLEPWLSALNVQSLAAAVARAAGCFAATESHVGVQVTLDSDEVRSVDLEYCFRTPVDEDRRWALLMNATDAEVHPELWPAMCAWTRGVRPAGLLAAQVREIQLKVRISSGHRQQLKAYFALSADGAVTT